MPAKHPNEYLAKHQFVPAQVESRPHPALGIVVVIPCHDEPALITTLASLWGCVRPRCRVEVIVVVNACLEDAEEVHARNRRTEREANCWLAAHRDPALAFHVLSFATLPRRHAGVGLARKIGMDEAVARFHAARRDDGIIVCLDADCECAPNYLVAIEEHFGDHPCSPGCSIHFEHPLDGDADAALYEGIIRYELFLRYYLNGLKHAGFPHAHHTVGSSMAVRSSTYEQQGGMNRRQAGEDFYFLNKVIRLGGFSELHTTTVVPSPRASRRVPFGTGRAMQDWVAGRDHLQSTYAPESFEDLRRLFARAGSFYEQCPSDWGPMRTLPDSIIEYLRECEFTHKLVEMQANTASADAFLKRFFAWFDAFRAFKFVRWAGAHYHPSEPLESAVRTLLRWRGEAADEGLETAAARDLLLRLRHIDRTGSRVLCDEGSPLPFGRGTG